MCGFTSLFPRIDMSNQQEEYALNAGGFVTGIDTGLVTDWPWETSHWPLPLSCELWAACICVLGHALVRRSSAEGQL